MNEWLDISEKRPPVGSYAVVIGKRTPFSRYVPMVVKAVKNGFVCPVWEEYITSFKYWTPIELPEEYIKEFERETK